jgi:RNA:NAD 2'-phosphotransferase (TPT1/KptA family)
MNTQRAFVQAIVSFRLRNVAERFGVDTDDAGFTTVEKVVLTAVSVAIAIAAGAAIRSKVTSMIDAITGP